MGEKLARSLGSKLAAHSLPEIQYKGIAPGSSLTSLSLTWNTVPPVCGPHQNKVIISERPRQHGGINSQAAY